MKLKSPTEEPIHVALLSGHAIVIGPEGRDTPKEFIRDAMIKGALPAEMSVSDIDTEAGGPDRMQSIVSGIKTMLESAPDKFTAEGLPNRKTLAQIVGFQVSAEEAAAAMKLLEAEA